MPATTYTINLILDYNFGKEAYDPQTTLYFGLSTTLIGADGTTITEPTGGYARKSFTNDKTATGWSDAAAGTLSNDFALTFAESDNVAGWGTLLSIFIIDTASGAGNVMWYYTLNPTLTVGDNTIVEFPVGAIMASMT